jgi:hypothetical protein
MKKRSLIVAIVLCALVPTSVAAYAYLAEFFRPHEIYQTDKHPLDVVAGDINGDEYLDVLTANRDGKSVSVFFGNGDGSLTPVDKIETEFGATSLALSDVDRDGNNDVVVTLCGPYCQDNKIGIYRGYGDGRFELAELIDVDGVPYNVAVADFNKDGWVDIAGTDYPGQRVIVLLSSEESGSYDEISLPTGLKPIALLVRDINGDGVEDIITSDHGSKSSSVYIADGANGFLERIHVHTGELPYSIALSDVDNDSLLDLLVAHSSSPGIVSVHLGQGDGTFEKDSSFETRDRLIYIDSGDFDGDEYADIIVTRNKERFASVYLSQNGVFDDPMSVKIIAENKIYSAAIAKMDDDDWPDLITVDYEQNTLSISLGEQP